MSHVSRGTQFQHFRYRNISVKERVVQFYLFAAKGRLTNGNVTRDYGWSKIERSLRLGTPENTALPPKPKDISFAIAWERS